VLKLPARLTKELAVLSAHARQARTCLELVTTTTLHLTQLRLSVFAIKSLLSSLSSLL